jgi:hypothetical protein
VSLFKPLSRNPLAVARQADAGFATVSFGLDRASLSESVTNENGVLIRSTALDIAGRAVTDTGIEGTDEVARYAAGGRAVSVSRRDGVLVSNVWDAAGRLAEVRHGGASVLSLACVRKLSFAFEAKFCIYMHTTT